MSINNINAINDPNALLAAAAQSGKGISDEDLDKYVDDEISKIAKKVGDPSNSDDSNSNSSGVPGASSSTSGTTSTPSPISLFSSGQ